MLETITMAMLLIGCCLASYFDVRARIIPNEITYSLIAMGLMFSGLIGNLESSFYAAIVMTPFLIALSLLGGMGAGDVKLLFAASLILGFPTTLYLLPVVLLFGAIAALAWLLASRFPRELDPSVPPGSALALPFAPVIFASILAVIFLPISHWVQT